MNISPKVYVPTLITVLAGALLALITGDKTFLIVALTGIAGGGIGAAAPPASGVKQAHVAELARGKRLKQRVRG